VQVTETSVSYNVILNHTINKVKLECHSGNDNSDQQNAGIVD